MQIDLEIYFGYSMMFWLVLVFNECLCFCFKKYSDKFKVHSIKVAILSFVFGVGTIFSCFFVGVELQVIFGLILFYLGLLGFIIFRALKLEITIN